jgi:hypothetical protein
MQKTIQLNRNHSQTKTVAEDFSDEDYNKRLIRVFLAGLEEDRFSTEDIPDMLCSLYRGCAKRKEQIASLFRKAGKDPDHCLNVLRSIPLHSIEAM